MSIDNPDEERQFEFREVFNLICCRDYFFFTLNLNREGITREKLFGSIFSARLKNGAEEVRPDIIRDGYRVSDE